MKGPRFAPGHDCISQTRSTPQSGSMRCARGITVAEPTSVAARSACVCGRAVAFLRLADLERPASEVRSVQRLRGARRVFMRHLHKTEAARATGVAIVDQGERFYDSVR